MISEATVSEPLDAASRGGAFDFRASKPKSRGPTWFAARSGWLGLSGVMASGAVDRTLGGADKRVAAGVGATGARLAGGACSDAAFSTSGWVA